MTPLFIPLRSEFFDAFKRGEKRVEYRKRGPRWNAETCFIGRPVVLSRGYGKRERLLGTITAFHYDTCPSRLPGWVECYGPNAAVAACIAIAVDGIAQSKYIHRLSSSSPVSDDVWEEYYWNDRGLTYVAEKMRDMEMRLNACLASATAVNDAWLSTQPDGIRDVIQNIRRNANLSLKI